MAPSAMSSGKVRFQGERWGVMIFLIVALLWYGIKLAIGLRHPSTDAAAATGDDDGFAVETLHDASHVDAGFGSGLLCCRFLAKLLAGVANL